MDYAQPDFYRFSTDSTELAKVAIKHTPLPAKKILELGAGCGVISCEFALGLAQELELHLCEKQHDYESYLRRNLEQLVATRRGISPQLHLYSWASLKESSFDVILSNPPYFLKGHGRSAPDSRKEVARRWGADEREFFYQLILSKLSPMGIVALTLREQPPEFFLKQTKLVDEVLLHARSEILTRIFVFALNVEANKALS